MLSNELLLKDAAELELEIERHCVGLGLDRSDKSQIRLFVHNLLQNLTSIKKAANHGDREARAKMELYGMTMLLHEMNAQTLGPEYLMSIDALKEQEPAWVVIAKAIWDELKSRDPETKE